MDRFLPLRRQKPTAFQYWILHGSNIPTGSALTRIGLLVLLTAQSLECWNSNSKCLNSVEPKLVSSDFHYFHSTAAESVYCIEHSSDWAIEKQKQTMAK